MSQFSMEFLYMYVAGKYREFQKLHEDGNFKEAAKLLLSLLTSSVAPKK